MASSLGATFCTDAVGSFPFVKGSVIEINAKTKVNEAFRTLIQNNLLSAPVYDDDKHRYLGFFDVQDAIGYATHMEHLFLGKETERTTHEVGEMLSIQATTRAVAPWVPVPPSTPMSEVILLLTKVRRVPVIDPTTNRVIKVISQSLVCHQMHETLSHMTDIPARFLQRPKDFGLGMKNVVTVGEGTLAREAFQILIEKNVSAVGVLDEEGALLTCITAKDIRLLPLVDQGDTDSAEDHTTEELLNLTAVEFVSKARLVSEKRGKARPAVVVVHVDTPVNQMIAKLSKTGMHRLFLVDGDHKPVGVFSVADAVRLLVE